MFYLISDANSGPSDDWAKGVAGIPYTYTIELRDLFPLLRSIGNNFSESSTLLGGGKKGKKGVY